MWVLRWSVETHIQFLVASRQEVPMLCTISVFYYHRLWCANIEGKFNGCCIGDFESLSPKMNSVPPARTKIDTWVEFGCPSVLPEIDSGPQMILGAELFISRWKRKIFHDIYLCEASLTWLASGFHYHSHISASTIIVRLEIKKTHYPTNDHAQLTKDI